MSEVNAEKFRVVNAEKFEAMEAELAALREELAVARSDISTWRIHHDRKSVALDAAEQRNAELVGLLSELRNTAYTKGGISLAAYIDPHLRPAESGASE